MAINMKRVNIQIESDEITVRGQTETEAETYAVDSAVRALAAALGGYVVDMRIGDRQYRERVAADPTALDAK